MDREKSSQFKTRSGSGFTYALIADHIELENLLAYLSSVYKLKKKKYFKSNTLYMIHFNY